MKIFEFPGITPICEFSLGKKSCFKFEEEDLEAGVLVTLFDGSLFRSSLYTASLAFTCSLSGEVVHGKGFSNLNEVKLYYEATSYFLSALSKFPESIVLRDNIENFLSSSKLVKFSKAQYNFLSRGHQSQDIYKVVSKKE